MVVNTDAAIAGIVVGVVILVISCVRLWLSDAIMHYVTAALAGIALGALVFVLRPIAYIAGVGLYPSIYAVCGILLWMVLARVFAERVVEKKAEAPTSGWLTLTRVACIALLLGFAIGAGAGSYDAIIALSLIGAPLLAIEAGATFALLHFEGRRLMRSLMLASLVAVLPLVAIIALGSLVLNVHPDVSSALVFIVSGLLLMGTMSSSLDVLRRRSWTELGVLALGPIIFFILLGMTA